MTDSPDLVRDKIAEAITALGAEFIARGEAESLYDINCGSCEDFASELVERLGGARDGIEIWWGENLSVDGDGWEWDVPLLTELFPATAPTHGLAWDDLADTVPRHAWVEIQGRHYDAECPDGVDNLFDLPLIRRMLEQMAEEKQARVTGPAGL